VGILAEDIERVRAATDFVAVAGEHIALKRAGRRWQGLCPFHAEKSPSFSINAEEGLYYCFGCQAKGDVITFVREVEHLDFAEAVERLAARVGIQLRYDDAATTRDRQQRQELVEAMARAVDWYHERLLTAADAGPARGYLRSRGYDRDVVSQWRLGWAPDEWDALARALKLDADTLQRTGLAFLNRRNRLQDKFRARVMFPIFDVRGDPVAFGGRKLAGDGPKYMNSPETPLYSKSKVLYGLDRAKADIVSAGEVIVCEGYTDVIGFALAGLPRAVATCGTALADEHFRMLKNFARRVVLAYDADAAGQAAAERFYEWERRYEIDIAVAALPPGADPADVARADPDALRAAVEGARPFLAFRLERVLGTADTRSAEGRARAAEAALAVVGEHPSELVRDQYLMQIADRCRIDVDQLRRGVVPLPTSAPPARARSAATRVLLPRDAEEQALLLAIHRRDDVAGRLHEVLFTDELHVAAFRALRSTESLADAIAAADPGAAVVLQRLAVEDEDADADDVIALLAERAATRAMRDLESEAKATGDLEAYSPILGWLKLAIEHLRESDTRVGTAEQLVAWLAGRGEEQG
jgi:DNA primase